MKKILLSILVVIFCFVSVPEFCVGAKSKIFGFTKTIRMVSTLKKVDPTVASTVDSIFDSKVNSVMKNFNKILRIPFITKVHIETMCDHTIKNYHIVTQEFAPPKPSDTRNGVIILEDSQLNYKVILNKYLDNYKKLCSDINILQDEGKSIIKNIEDIEEKIKNPDRSHQVNDNEYDELKKLRKELKNNEDKILQKEKEITKEIQEEKKEEKNSLKKKIPTSFNLQTEKSLRAFINWVIHKKERPQDNENSDRAVITAINATDKENKTSAILDVLSNVKSVTAYPQYKDKQNNTITCLKLELTMNKEQHYFKQTKVDDSYKIESGYSNKMVMILKKNAFDVWVSTIYIKE